MIRVRTNFPNENYKTKVVSEKHEIVVDEPIELGGKDAGMMPTELLCGALASCTSITLKMYGDRKEWNFSEAYVEVILVENEDKTKHLHRIIHFGPDATAEMRARALLVANKCPVHKMLENGIKIITEVQ